MTHIAPVAPSVQAYNRYGCRCEACRQIKARYHKDYERRRYLSRGNLTVPVDLVREHLLWLRDNGVGGVRIAELTGMSLTSMHVWRIISGKTKRVRRSTAEAILAITPDQGTDASLVDATLTWRRLHGLIALGYSAAFLARELGLSTGVLPSPAAHTTVGRSRAVIALVQRYGNGLGPDTRARRRGERMGWPPIGAFDDDLRELSDRAQTHERNPHAARAS